MKRLCNFKQGLKQRQHTEISRINNDKGVNKILSILNCTLDTVVVGHVSVLIKALKTLFEACLI